MPLQSHFTTQRKAHPSITNASEDVNIRDNISICNFDLSVNFACYQSFHQIKMKELLPVHMTIYNSYLFIVLSADIIEENK